MSNPMQIPVIRVHKHELLGRCFACGETSTPTIHVYPLSHQSVIIFCLTCAAGLRELLAKHTSDYKTGATHD